MSTRSLVVPGPELVCFWQHTHSSLVPCIDFICEYEIELKAHYFPPCSLHTILLYPVQVHTTFAHMRIRNLVSKPKIKKNKKKWIISCEWNFFGLVDLFNSFSAGDCALPGVVLPVSNFLFRPVKQDGYIRSIVLTRTVSKRILATEKRSMWGCTVSLHRPRTRGPRAYVTVKAVPWGPTLFSSRNSKRPQTPESPK